MSVSPDTSTKSPKTALNHLGYLDGLRGLAALYVVLHHAVMYFHFSETAQDTASTLNNILPAFLEPIAILFNKGRYAVPIFIALSGFCLMLPVVKSQGKMSYSAFELMTHAPLLQLSRHYIFSRWDAPPTVVFSSFHLVTVALILPISYLFHCLFERPFLNEKRSGNAQSTPKLSEA